MLCGTDAGSAAPTAAPTAAIPGPRDKARFFTKTKLIPTLDACSATVVKSDTLISPELHASLREAFAQLIKDYSGRPDWHPGTNNVVKNLVNLSLYSLVRGRTRGFCDDQVVGVANGIEK